MATDATHQSIPATRHETSSTAWFWWKETRQLAPLLVLLIIVSVLIVALHSFWGLIDGQTFRLRLPYEVMMLMFPGLFATGAGPLLVGQERAQRTLDWLSLLPISARRLTTTKLCVALVGLIVMWAFSFFLVALFDLSNASGASWTIGQRATYSDNPFSYPVWISHSFFILLAGFFVAWRIKNQFYSLIALIPLAFSPLIATSLVSEIVGKPRLAGELDWVNFGFTMLGIVVVAPLTFRAASRTLGPDPAPPVQPLLGVSPHSPAKVTNDAIAPTFATQSAPIIWQSIHSARGMLAILIGMLLLSFLAALVLANVDQYRGIVGKLPFFLAPLAVCWLGISVFKHDGNSERIRFLADRGVSPTKTYFALHAVPLSILSTALILYGLWNLTLSHRESVSDFAAGLPTLATLLVFVGIVYGISQWVSQFVRTLILSVILAPILSIIAAGWLAFSYAGLGMPAYGLVLCGLAPLLATLLMMRRYMDSRDRPATLITGVVVVAWITLVPIAFAATHVLSIPTIDPKTKMQLLSEVRRTSGPDPQIVQLSISGYDGDFELDWDPMRDRMQEVETRLSNYELDAQRMVLALKSDQPADRFSASVNAWESMRWHGGMMLARIRWRNDPTEANWAALASWIDASATLLPALRRSPFLDSQEVADRLEVLLIDTLKSDVPSDRNNDPAVRAAIDALGTPASRAAARRKAILVNWDRGFKDDQGNYTSQYLHILDHEPQGLLPWVTPRLYDSLAEAMLAGVDAAKSHSDDSHWRRRLHELHQYGGVFETSRYGEAMRSRPAIETMSLGSFSGYGQLWGRDWEYEDLKNEAGTENE